MNKNKILWEILTLIVSSAAISEIYAKNKTSTIANEGIAFLSVPTSLSINQSSGVLLLKYEIHPQKIEVGDTVNIIWYWKCVGDIGDSFSIWICSGMDWENEILGDPVIIPKIYEIIIDTFAFVWPERFKSGTYIISISGGAIFFKDKFYHFRILGSDKVRIYRKNTLILATTQVE